MPTFEPDTAIIIPCFNEEKRLPVDIVDECIGKAQKVIFIFVNDGSSDGTLALLQKLNKKHPEKTRLCNLPKNVGKGEAVRHGFLTAFDLPVRYAGFWDADLATPLTLIDELSSILRQKPQVWMVFGVRIPLLGRAIRRTPVRALLSFGYKAIVRFLLRIHLTDPLCGAKIFRINDALKDACSSPFTSRWSFDVEMVSRFLRWGRRHPKEALQTRIYEEPLREWREVAGSKIKPINFLSVPLELLRIYFQSRR